MEIKTITNLVAADGMWLTDGEIFVKTIQLAKEDNMRSWHECTNDEKEQWEREHPDPEPAEVVE